MHHESRLVFAMVVAIAVVGPFQRAAAQQASAAHTHIGHVLEAFSQTPNGEGLLATAMSEAETAAEHASLAAGGDPTDIDPMIRHTRHVLHAIDPAEFPNGPGLGFGLRPAVQGIARHIELAAASEGASQNVRTHAEHVSTAANAVAERADRIVELARQVLAAGVYNEARPLVQQLRDLCAELLPGADASGDGTISLDEGGLSHVQRHMTLMAEGEGLN